MAMETAPRARLGATDCSHVAKPGARRPAGRRTSMCRRDGFADPTLLVRRVRFAEPALLPPSAIALTRPAKRVVRLHDRLHQLVTDDVALIEVQESDALDFLHD